MKVDVTIATKNNEDTIEKCIECIKMHIPFNKIILIDDSNDKTPELAKNLGAVVYHKKVLLGEKRFLQAKLASTEWIASIDSDIYVFSNWWNLMSKEIAPDVGAISAYLKSDFDHIFPSYERFTKFCAVKTMEKTGRGSTIGNNLMRRTLILDMESDLLKVHTGEDSLISAKINEFGFNWKKITVPTGFHYHEDPISHHKMAYEREGKSVILNKGSKGLISIFTSFLNIQYMWIIFSVNERKIDLSLYRFLLVLYLNYLKGILTHKELN